MPRWQRPGAEPQPLAARDAALLALLALDRWLQQARERIAQRQSQAWASQAALLETQGDLAQALALCESIVALRP